VSRARTLGLLVLLALGLPASLVAAELEEVAVSDQDGVYQISLRMLLDVPARQVREVLTDYRHIYRLNPSIVETRLLPTPDAGRAARVYTRMQSCVGFYCREFSRVEDVWEHPSGEIETRIVPHMSDFDSGSTVWRIRDLGEHTELDYEASLEPRFFVPPVVGSYFVKRKFKEEALLSLHKIECIARVNLASEKTYAVASYAKMPTGDPC
jgi:hypothetical protein